MDWVTLVSTAVGATVALLGTVLANTLGNRAHRERDNRAERSRSYLDLLLALNGSLAQLRVVAAKSEAADLEYEAGQALSANKVYEARERMIMTADRSVLAAAETAFLALVKLRRAIADGARLKSPEYHEPYHVYAGALWQLRRSLREDLGGGALSPADLEREDWDSAATCRFCRARATAAALV